LTRSECCSTRFSIESRVSCKL